MGSAAIRRIVDGARTHLAPGGTLVVEHGYDQSERVRELFEAAGFAEIVAAKDLAGIPRVVAGRHEATRCQREGPPRTGEAK